MQAIGGDSDFSTKPELPAVGEPCRGVMVDAGAVDFAQIAFCASGILSDDAV